MEREINPTFQPVVQFIDEFPNFLQVKPTGDGLNPEVILFVDHDAETFISVNNHRPGTVRFSDFPADELPFEQKKPVNGRRFLQIDKIGVFLGKQVRHCFSEHFLDLRSILDAGSDQKRVAGNIPRQANPAGDDNIILRPFAIEPLSRSGKKIFDFHESFSLSPQKNQSPLFILLKKMGKDTPGFKMKNEK
jgi:hypothetical protein